MATYFATTHGKTFKILRNRQGRVREISQIQSNHIQLRPWQYLDLLAKIMPKYVHAVDYEVQMGENPVEHPHDEYTSHPCLIVKKIGSETEKRYRLNHCVGENWILTIKLSHLRALVYWWRCNRSQYEKAVCEWGIWRNED